MFNRWTERAANCGMVAVVNAVRQRVRVALRTVARDETADSACRSALVLAPHPDDETIGCGATILRKVAAGAAVHVLVVTDGRHSHRSAALSPEALAELRRKEMAQAAERLGLPADSVRWAGFEDGTVSRREDELVTVVKKLIAELAPDEVFTTPADEPHPDHAAVGRAARKAANRQRVLEYPVWLWGSWPLRRGDRLGSTLSAAGKLAARKAVKVSTDGFLAGKLHALEAHESQLRRPAAVPESDEWAGLPADILAAASEPYELFIKA
jgi:LmbE family N-acetylglucosaminyl deacetylase